MATPRWFSRWDFAALAGLAALVCLYGALLPRLPDPMPIHFDVAGLPPSGHYRCGVFYVNPDGPRLWVEKRFGIGWTLNYARPAALWLTLLMAAAIPALVLAVRGAIR